MSNEIQIKYDVFISGQEVNLVVLTEEIAEKSDWYSWLNDAETTKNMQQCYFPSTPQKQLKFFKENIANSISKLQLGIMQKQDNVLIGMISLNSIDYQNRRCEIAGFIGEKKYKSTKYWLEANKLIFKHAVNTLGVRRIYGGSLAKEVSIFYRRMLGFHDEGVHVQEIYKNGTYRDVYYFARIFEEALR